jgi:hypothetical protein
MINQPRLSQLNTLKPQRIGSEEKIPQNTSSMLSELPEGPLNASDPTIAGVSAALTPNSLPAGNSFSQLLAMSKIDNKTDMFAAKDRIKQDSKATDTLKEVANGRAEPRESNLRKQEKIKAGKSKDKKASNSDSDERALSQILMSQQNSQKLNTDDRATSNRGNPSSREAKVQTDSSSTERNQGAELATYLESKKEPLMPDRTTTNRLASDSLEKIAGHFDQVNIELNGNQSSQNHQSASTDHSSQTQLSKSDWNQNDLTLRDLLSQQTLQEATLDRMSQERIEQQSLLKSLQSDQLRAADTLKQLQARDASNASASQWLSVQDLPTEQNAIMSALSFEQNSQIANPGRSGDVSAQASGLNSSGGAFQSTASSPTLMKQDAVAGLQSLSSMGNEHLQNSSQQQNSSSNSSPQKDGSKGLNEVTGTRTDALKSASGGLQTEEANDTRTRAAERSREIARAAALRAQSIASELSAKGGGSAKIQIKDSRLGVVELRINMTDNKHVTIDLVANSDRIKQELEKQSDDLKVGLEKQNVVLEGVRFVTDTKLGDSGTQNSSQNDSSRSGQQSQQQQQQNMSSFSEGRNGSQQQNSSGNERFLDGSVNARTNQIPSNGSIRKNYSGQIEPQTNVQRSANGSLKITA